jgi:glycolate oxidase FAD binding subunit
MSVVTPRNPEELAEVLRRAASHLRTIALAGNSSKRLMAGPVAAADECVSMAAMNGILAYEPRDLTVSVEAGMPWRELTCLLAADRLMAPLDPPFAGSATVGGVVASNSSGPRRRLYGASRDIVIGMQFATLNGKLVQSGGMVVKNAAGFDLAKLMIGSFGTLAAIASVNFKVFPMPVQERSFLLPFQAAAAAFAARDRILAGSLEPAALDLLNPAASAGLGERAWLLAVRAGGNQAAMDRYQRELAGIADGKVLEGAEHEEFWRIVENYTPGFLERHPEGAVVRVSSTLKGLETAMESFGGPALARAGSGVCYGYFAKPAKAAQWMSEAAGRGWKAVVEFAPAEAKGELDLWPIPGNDLEMMRRIKKLFDPDNVLNRGRLYKRI